MSKGALVVISPGSSYGKFQSSPWQHHEKNGHKPNHEVPDFILVSSSAMKGEVADRIVKARMGLCYAWIRLRIINH